MTVALLHPGAMGAAIGEQLVAAGQTCCWLPHGRGQATRARATAAGFLPLSTVDELADCAVVISICPPAAALEVARQVAATGFTGCYVDANAISPRHSKDIAAILTKATIVDGGIVGPPPTRAGTTHLYLSGVDAHQVHTLFANTIVRPVVLPGPVGAASALKLAFASYNKMSLVLAAQAHALAARHGVAGELVELAGAVLPATPLAAPDRLPAAAARAWRWAPEMREIADACEDVALPGDLPRAAEAVLHRWERYKDDPAARLTELLDAL